MQVMYGYRKVLYLQQHTLLLFLYFVVKISGTYPFVGVTDKLIVRKGKKYLACRISRFPNPDVIDQCDILT